ncbi:phage portal protein [Clostridium paraputrificum]|uniref:Phage portal protein n=1 Tax=Clostridium paraputrificum TaxID=29363 RepID=A0A1B8RT56_9CLOT|nr:phage portal protein [Clostridium paraputrificum]OBY11914.1 phage portal protein [Clostridium paraputrificum]
MALIRDREFLGEDGTIPMQLITKCIEEHQEEVTNRYSKLNSYYDGVHKILFRTLTTESLPNNKIVCNHAEYITDMATGYVFGAPITYSGDGADELNKIFTEIDEDSHNNELALDMSIFGVGYELLYMNDDEVPYPELAVVSPLNSFLVVDSTVKQKPMFAVTYFEKRDIEGMLKGYDINVYTDKNITHYFFTDLTSKSPTIDEPEEHYFSDIPLIEYKNNKRLKGDFEGVITLIDAYNLLQSDRVNDKEQVVDALLAVIGASLGDNEEEKVETAKLLKELKIIELDEGGDAKWLVKNLNETEIEVLKKALKDDIHEFSKVPCLTDENFVGNASGIAMKYKLLGFEQLGRTKERYFKQGLRQRLKLMSNIENIRAKNIDSSNIDISMKRSLPVDDELAARTAQETEGFISWETRIKRFDGEIDIDEERKRLEEENKKKVEDQQKMFGSYDFKSTGGEVDEE